MCAYPVPLQSKPEITLNFVFFFFKVSLSLFLYFSISFKYLKIENFIFKQSFFSSLQKSACLAKWTHICDGDNWLNLYRPTQSNWLVSELPYLPDFTDVWSREPWSFFTSKNCLNGMESPLANELFGHIQTCDLHKYLITNVTCHSKALGVTHSPLSKIFCLPSPQIVVVIHFILSHMILI